MDLSRAQAWIQIAQVLIGIGVDVAGKIGAMIAAVHPDMTPADRTALCDAILADDAVRLAFARSASGEAPTA